MSDGRRVGARHLGVDGCRGGWFGVALDAGGGWQFAQTSTFAEMLARFPRAQVLVDIPIGLPEDEPRAAEAGARALLGSPRAASVFAVPVRRAVYAPDYATACALNREALGKALSRQAWHLCPKIREVDELLATRPALRRCVHEAHPELCLWALAGGEAMAASKKTAAGREQRLAVISAHFAATRDVVAAALSTVPRRRLAPDDAIDALALAVSGLAGAGRTRRVPERTQRDRTGLAMQMRYPDPAWRR